METVMSEISAPVQSRAMGGKIEEKLLNSFFVLYKTARLVEVGNATFQNQLRTFMEALRTAAGERPQVVIKNLGGHYFVNENLVRFEGDRDHLEITIENACLHLPMIGTTQALVELVYQVEESRVEWELSEDGDLHMAVTVGR